MKITVLTKVTWNHNQQYVYGLLRSYIKEGCNLEIFY